MLRPGGGGPTRRPALARPSSRHSAWELLRAVWSDGAYANLVWPKILTRSGLTEQDRRFATELGYGTLRTSGQLREILARASGSNPGRWQPEVLWVLQLGAYQLLHMRTPTHAAVNESVSLARTVGVPRASGLVNAVLRKVSVHSLDEWLEALCREAKSETACLAMAYAHPEWMVEELRHSLEREGRDSEIEALLSSHNAPARVTAALLPGLVEPGEDEERTPYSPIGAYLQGDPSLDDRIGSAQARIQDEGSQLAALVAARALPLQEGYRVLDMCSGPGGKAAVLLSESVAVGAYLTALEVAPHRAELVKEALAGFGPDSPSEVLVADATKFDGGPFDRIVIDAPCSGLGALRRRPEARWTKEPGDLAALRESQAALLNAGARLLADGGVLVYVTCSPVVSETTDQISALLDQHPELVALNTSELLNRVTRQDVPTAGVGTAVQLWPHRHGTDAMFIQVLRKRAEPTG
jgi:16S rRNA (cytosine967-C5)-methyltransferase